MAVIFRARERLWDVMDGQVYLDQLLRHVEDLYKLDWSLLGQDYDGYDEDGPSGYITPKMIDSGLGIRGCLPIPRRFGMRTCPPDSYGR